MHKRGWAKCTIVIPAFMGYGTNGAGKSILSNATLIFNIELIKRGLGSNSALYNLQVQYCNNSSN